jgi:hypothetical protein
MASAVRSAVGRELWAMIARGDRLHSETAQRLDRMHHHSSLDRRNCFSAAGATASPAPTISPIAAEADK